jgi:hypothetical protein
VVQDVGEEGVCQHGCAPNHISTPFFDFNVAHDFRLVAAALRFQPRLLSAFSGAAWVVALKQRLRKLWEQIRDLWNLASDLLTLSNICLLTPSSSPSALRRPNTRPHHHRDICCRVCIRRRNSRRAASNTSLSSPSCSTPPACSTSRPSLPMDHPLQAFYRLHVSTITHHHVLN